MCGRFRIEISPKDIIGFYRLIEEIDKRYKRYELDLSSPGRDYYPGSEAPVLTPEGFQLQTWGFPLEKKLVFNGRSESIDEKPMFRSLVQDHRCAVPASAFYEWNNKRKFSISTEAPFFFMAGLYRTWQEEGQPKSRFVILTTDADQQMQSIHPRMPVLLEEASLKDYLNPERPFAAIQSQLRPWGRGLRIELAPGEQTSFF